MKEKAEKEGKGRVRRNRVGEGMREARKGKRRITKRKRKRDGHRIFQFSHSDHSSTILFYLIKSYFKLSNFILSNFIYFHVRCYDMIHHSSYFLFSPLLSSPPFSIFLQITSISKRGSMTASRARLPSLGRGIREWCRSLFLKGRGGRYLIQCYTYMILSYI